MSRPTAAHHPRSSELKVLAALAAAALAAALPGRASAEDLRDYEASTGVLPGRACTGPDYSGLECWGEFYDTFFYPGDIYGDTSYPYDTSSVFGCSALTPTFSGGALVVDTTSITPSCLNGHQWWFEYPAYSDGSNSFTCGNERTLNFQQGSYLEFKLQVDSSAGISCGGEPNYGWLAEFGDPTLSMTIQLSSTAWVLSNNANSSGATYYGPFPFDTVSAPHVYRIETFPGGQKVFIDGVLQQTLAYTAESSIASGLAGFGDSGGAGCDGANSKTKLYYYKYGLTCGTGYIINGDGTACVDVDECAINNGGCDSGATCVNLPGTRECLAADACHSNVVCGADCAACPSPAAVGVSGCGACVPPQYVYAPSDHSYGMVSFEDLWPQNGDLDFNDLNTAYNYLFALDATGNIIGLQATFQPLSLGASLLSGLYLHLPVSASLIAHAELQVEGGAPFSVTPENSMGAMSLSDAVFTIAGNPRSTFTGDPSGFINTVPTLPAVGSLGLTLSVLFTAPLDPSDFDTGKAPFDVFINRNSNPAHQVHLSQYDGSETGADASLFHTADDASNLDGSGSGHANNTGRYYCNADGLPFALAFPALADWAIEKTSIDNLYPGITTFASSGGTSDTNFYLSPDTTYAWQSNLTAGSPQTLPTPPGPGDLFPSCTGR